MTTKKTLSLDRVVTVAGEEFSRRRYEDVSVSEIAQNAHCSTSTIYEVFGGKVELFRSAMLMRLTSSWPEKADPQVRPALLGLVQYFDKRMRSLASKESRQICRALFEQNYIMNISVTEELAKQRTDLQEMFCDRVSSAIAEGTLKTLPVESVSYLLAASCGYESVLYGMTFGVEYAFDFNEVTRKTFLPFLTEPGVAILEDFLKKE
ncbi:MAG: TetR/AcrR family transcriptional regulator [Novosphingobium sp.]